MGGRSVLVTGAAGGIGRAVAHAFAAHGDRVALHYRTSADRAAATLAELPGSGHLLARADLTDPQAVREMVDGVAEEFGGIDVLVNNAGGTVTEHPVASTPYEGWQRAWRDTLGMNLVGPANVTWCAARHMIAAGRGRIVNVTSRGAFRGEPTQPAYGAAKAGMNAFGQSLALSLAPHGIAVLSVAPGFVATPRQEDPLSGPDGAGMRAQSPFNRVAEPEEVAHAVLFLASEQAEFCSGAILDLNGASYLRS